MKPAKKIFFIIATLLLPVILFLLLEIGLRITNYGPDLSLFRREIISGEQCYTMNPEIGKRYFYQVGFSPYTTPDYFTVQKSQGTYRIFCLGASTTVGYPYWYNASFSAFLRNRLSAMFPDKKLEIINLGLTATNSFTVVDMAEELPQYDPDLIIVYDGHNEFYGALGIGSRETLGSSRWTAKLYLRLIHIKTFQLFRDVVSSISSLFTDPSAPQERGTTMERLSRGKYIPYKSEMYMNALEIFRANVGELKEICSEHSIPLLLASQVSNLKDHKPFISGEYPGTTESEQQTFKRTYEDAVTLYNEGKIESSLALFRSLLYHDSLRADIHFYIGKCLMKLKQTTAANDEFVKARDYDQLRFRASSEFNEAVRQACDGTNSFFVDMEETFAQNSEDSLIGNELIFEHLHPNARGYFLMAKAFADVMRTNDLFATNDEWRNSKQIDESELWKSRYVTELDERLAKRKVEILTAAWPFTQNTVPIVSNIADDDAIGNIAEQIVINKTDWVTAHQKAAEYYLSRNEKELAGKEYETIINLIPYEIQSYLKAAKVYLDLENLSKVKELLLASLEIKKTKLAYRALGDIALKQEKPLDAISYYEKMAGFDQDLRERLENGYMLALAKFNAKQFESARNQSLLLLQIQPDFTPAVELLAQINKQK